jgi:hypothetical protein
MYNLLYLVPTVGATDERLAVSSSSVSLASASWSDNTRAVIIDVQTANVMVTFDGSTPSATNGHDLIAGEKYTFHREMAKAAKFIRKTNDAVVHATELTY